MSMASADNPPPPSSSLPSGATYKASGVDLDVYAETMSRLPPLMRRTYTPRVVEWPNGFAGLFRLDDRVRLLTRKYHDPVLVSSTDGVGTKLKLAFATGRHHTVGRDLVAMSVNDCLCAGAEPLFFLDYIAMPRDNPDLTASLVKGISDGCLEAECALLGGETAILPEMYHPGEYDLAGFCVGVVERRFLIDGREVRQGDKLVGLGSTGLHSNGYSLARKIVFEIAGLTPESIVPEWGRSVADEFLEPTRIYVRAFKTVQRSYRVKRTIHAIAHITGGGLLDNLPRVLPRGVEARVETTSWEIPPVFPWLNRVGSVPPEEQYRVFNMGIGLVLVVSDYYAEAIARRIREESDTPAWIIGELVAHPEGPEASPRVQLI